MSSMQKKSLIATAAIFCCRFTGLLREVVYTGLFGATGALDAFLTAFRIPNMLRDMFAEGALSQSFTSVMSKVERQEGREAAWKMARQVISQLLSLMLCIVALGVLLSGFLMQQLYPERAQVVMLMDDSGTALPETAPEASVIYQGITENKDGLKEAVFRGDIILSCLTSKSCIRVDELERRAVVGETFTLSPTAPAKPASAESKAFRVEAQDFMGLAANLCRIMWPFILLASLSALCMGALNVFGIFGLPNLASAAFNLTTVAVGLALGWWIDPAFGPDALYGFAVAVLFGGAAQVLVQLPKLRKEGFAFGWNIGLRWQLGRLAFADAAVRRIWLLMIPGVIAAGITQTNVFINTAFALYLPGGSVTALSSAFHLWQLPVALFGVAVGMVVLPSVSRMTLTSGGQSDIPVHLARAMRFVAFFAVPSAVFLGIWGEEIVSIFFQRGRFDAAASALTGQVLAAYSLGLLAYAGMKVLQPVFLALEKPWAPAGLALVACAISVGMNYVFVHVFHLGAQWLALTTSVVTTLNFFFYFFYLRHLLGNMAAGVLLPGLLRILVAGVLLGLICWEVEGLFFENFTSWGFMARFAALAVGGTMAGVLYLAACYVCRVPELEQFAARFLRRRKASR